MAFTALKKHFACARIKRELERNFDAVEVSSLTHHPKPKKPGDPLLFGLMKKEGFSAEFTALSKEKHNHIQGKITYVPSMKNGFFSEYETVWAC